MKRTIKDRPLSPIQMFIGELERSGNLTKCLSRLSEHKAELVQALSSGSEIYEVNSIPLHTKHRTIRLDTQVA